MSTQFSSTRFIPVKQLYTRDEAASMLSISTVTLDRLTRTGAIKPRRVGARVLYTTRELERFAHVDR